jgi:hypothetical protein
MAKKWEYKVIRLPPLPTPRMLIEPELDKIGDEGWELVDVTFISGCNPFTQYTFKREKQKESEE